MHDFSGCKKIFINRKRDEEKKMKNANNPHIQQKKYKIFRIL